MRTSTIVFCISAHGLGHLSQVAPVINRLGDQRPDIAVTIRSGLTRDQLAARVQMLFVHQPVASDFGFVMKNAIDIDMEATLERYVRLHSEWPRRVRDEAHALIETGADLVISNVAYLPLAGAHAAGIPSLAFCSLNWADLFRHYFGHHAQAQPVLDHMADAYNRASTFLRVSPAMPMPDLGNAVAVAPIGSVGCACREQLERNLQIGDSRRLVLMAMGGIDFPIGIGTWPIQEDVVWLVPRGIHVARADVRCIDEACLPFTSVLASVDAVVTKPGYGTFIEAAAAGIPILFVPREHWPEEPYLVEWLRRHACAEAISRDSLNAGDLAPALASLWQRSGPPRPELGGEDALVGLLLALLDQRD